MSLLPALPVSKLVFGIKNLIQIYRYTILATKVMFSIALELPGLILAAVIVDRLGRKVSMAALLLLCFIFMLPLMIHQPAGLTTALLFGARACIMGSFTLMFLYAPEVSHYTTIIS